MRGVAFKELALSGGGREERERPSDYLEGVLPPGYTVVLCQWGCFFPQLESEGALCSQLGQPCPWAQTMSGNLVCLPQAPTHSVEQFLGFKKAPPICPHPI